LGENQITPEQEQQLNWILDDAYEQITTSIARDRQLEPAVLSALIDRAPHSAEAARTAGLVDDIAYEDTLSVLLAEPSGRSSQDEPAPGPAADGQAAVTTKPDARARLSTWSEARPMLFETRRRPARKYIGVVSLEGAITMGPSRSSPLPIPLISGNAAGEKTLTNLLRQAEKDRRMAALVIQLDSGGGSALASDLIWRQVQRIANRLPVVTYMGNMAASGGYYVAAASHRIVAQPLTLTGSIGVVTLHISTGGLYEKLSVNRVSLQRGERANLNSDFAPLSDEERQVLWNEITDAYQRFLGIVASGRSLEVESLDEICAGRVWTGRQARHKKLVDEHGDLQDAIAAAAELAGLLMDDRHDVPVYSLYPESSGHVLPKSFEEPAQILQLLSPERLSQFAGQPMFLLPVEITLR